VRDQQGREGRPPALERLQEAAGTDLESVVEAFDVALGKTMKRIVEWALATPLPATGRGGRRRR